MRKKRTTVLVAFAFVLSLHAPASVAGAVDET